MTVYWSLQIMCLVSAIFITCLGCVEFFPNSTDLTGLTGSVVNLQKEEFLLTFWSVCAFLCRRVPDPVRSDQLDIPATTLYFQF